MQNLSICNDLFIFEWLFLGAILFIFSGENFINIFFLEEGIYNVFVMIINVCGFFVVILLFNVLEGLEVIVVFDYDVEEICIFFMVNIINNSIGDNLFYEWLVVFVMGWSFIDNIDFNILNFIFRFSEVGIYMILFIVLSDCGSDMWIEMIIVWDCLFVELEDILDEFCDIVFIQFLVIYDQFGLVDEVIWFFFGGILFIFEGLQFDGLVFYNELGIYIVMVIVSNECGSLLDFYIFMII